VNLTRAELSHATLRFYQHLARPPCVSAPFERRSNSALLECSLESTVCNSLGKTKRRAKRGASAQTDMDCWKLSPTSFWGRSKKMLCLALPSSGTYIIQVRSRTTEAKISPLLCWAERLAFDHVFRVCVGWSPSPSLLSAHSRSSLCNSGRCSSSAALARATWALQLWQT
jgi:hypothetical protein